LLQAELAKLKLEMAELQKQESEWKHKEEELRKKEKVIKCLLNIVMNILANCVYDIYCWSWYVSVSDDWIITFCAM
jgi:hypothetical protein